MANPRRRYTTRAALVSFIKLSFNYQNTRTITITLIIKTETRWNAYRTRYFLIVVVFALPGALLNIIKQHSTGDSDLGCSPSYEKLGLWYEVFFTELLPIVIGFCFNVYVFVQVRNRMTLKAFPQSVRKKRRRIMYHYIIVCIVCWSPTILFYFTEISGILIPALEMIARASLYLTGFLNFIVFGMQDPHLKKSFLVVVYRLGITSGAVTGMGADKSVMFEEATISKNADLSKDKRSIYKYHKLSNEDKRILYANRPDLDPKDHTFTEPLLQQQQFESVENGKDDEGQSEQILDSGFSATTMRTGGWGTRAGKNSDFVTDCKEAYAMQDVTAISSVFHCTSSVKDGNENYGSAITGKCNSSNASASMSGSLDAIRQPQQQELMQVTKSQYQPDVESSLVDDSGMNGVPQSTRSVLGRNEREDTSVTDDSSDDEDDEDHELANIINCSETANSTLVRN